jgi:hypothetical protein
MNKQVREEMERLGLMLVGIDPKSIKKRMWFHTFTKNSGRMENQGQILEVNLEEGTVTVQLYSWISGCATNTDILNLSDYDWVFYKTDAEMRKRCKEYDLRRKANG